MGFEGLEGVSAEGGNQRGYDYKKLESEKPPIDKVENAERNYGNQIDELFSKLKEGEMRKIESALNWTEVTPEFLKKYQFTGEEENEQVALEVLKEIIVASTEEGKKIAQQKLDPLFE